MQPIAITARTLVTALGRGIEDNWAAIIAERSGLQPAQRANLFPTWLGEVNGLDDQALSGPWQGYDCRNQRLARLALEMDDFRQQVRATTERYGPERIGVFVGTSTSGIEATEQAFAARQGPGHPLPAQYDLLKTHNIGSLAEFTRRWLDLAGPALCISTACSSSAKVFASAARALATGQSDAAVVGGVDSLCLTTLYGFHSLNLVSSAPCRPWDRNRAGINIGEAGGFMLLERDPAAESTVAACLLGYAESADAWHMSTPHPEGRGAQAAMREALQRAGLAPADIDYLNLHGTATQSNDAAEDAAVFSVFGEAIACSSTKGWTGHTLGAAGIVEAVIATLVLEHQRVPGTLHLQTPDPALRTPVLQQGEARAVDHVMSNSFGFGGSNCSLVFGR